MGLTIIPQQNFATIDVDDNKYKSNTFKALSATPIASDMTGVMSSGNGVCYDSNYLYIIDPSNATIIRKFDINTLAFVSQSSSVGGTMTSLTENGNYLYCTNIGDLKVKKYLKSDLSFVAQTAALNNNALKVVVNSTHAFVIGDNNNKVKKYLLSDMSFVAETAAYEAAINDIAIDETYIYIGGIAGQKVKKYLVSDLSFVAETAVYGATIGKIVLDNDNIYVLGDAASSAIKKYDKATMSLQKTSKVLSVPANTVLNILSDGIIFNSTTATKLDKNLVPVSIIYPAFKPDFLVVGSKLYATLSSICYEIIDGYSISCYDLGV